MFTGVHEQVSTTQPRDRLVSFAQAREIVGISRSKIYLLLAEGSFPKPVKVGRSNFFSALELQTWIDAALATRDTEARQ